MRVRSFAAASRRRLAARHRCLGGVLRRQADRRELALYVDRRREGIAGRTVRRDADARHGGVSAELRRRDADLREGTRCDRGGYIVGVARFIDASIYRDTFSAIRIAILFFTITIFFFLIFFFFPHNYFHLGRKDT